MKLIRIPLPERDFASTVEEVSSTGELYLGQPLPLGPDGPPEFVLFETLSPTRILVVRIRKKLPFGSFTAFRAQIWNHFPHGLKKPDPEWMSTDQAAAWMMIEPESFRIMVSRLEIPRIKDPNQPKAAKYRFLYKSEDVWTAALLTKAQQHRVDRIRERELIIQKGTIFHA